MGCTGRPEAVCVGQASCDKSFRQKGRRVLCVVAHSYEKRRGRMRFTDSLISHHWFREWEPRRPKKWHRCEFLWVRNSGLSSGVVTSAPSTPSCSLLHLLSLGLSPPHLALGALFTELLSSPWGWTLHRNSDPLNERDEGPTGSWVVICAVNKSSAGLLKTTLPWVVICWPMLPRYFTLSTRGLGYRLFVFPEVTFLA